MRYGHLTMEIGLWIGGQCLSGFQSPLFLFNNSGNTEWLESRSKLKAVLSSNRISIALASESTSTSETVFPRTSGKRVNLDRGLGLRLRLRAAICRLSCEGDLWLGLCRCLEHWRGPPKLISAIVREEHHCRPMIRKFFYLT